MNETNGVKFQAPSADVVTSKLPANPVQSNAVRFRDISQVQIHFFHRVAAIIIKGGHVGAFDRAKLRPPAQNCPVHHTYSAAKEKQHNKIIQLGVCAGASRRTSYWVLVPLDPRGNLRLGYAQRCPHSLNTAERRDWSDGCEHCLAGAEPVGFLYSHHSGGNVNSSLIQRRFPGNGECFPTLSSTLCPMWLPERDKPFGTKTLIAALRVLALLRTCAVYLTLVHVWCGKQNSRSARDNAEVPVVA